LAYEMQGDMRRDNAGDGWGPTTLSAFRTFRKELNPNCLLSYLRLFGTLIGGRCKKWW